MISVLFQLSMNVSQSKTSLRDLPYIILWPQNNQKHGSHWETWKEQLLLNSHCNQSIRRVLLRMVSWRRNSKKLRSVSPRKPQSSRPSMNDPKTTPFPKVRKPEGWRDWPKIVRAGNSHPRLVSFLTENSKVLQRSFLINLLVWVMLIASSIPQIFCLKNSHSAERSLMEINISQCK